MKETQREKLIRLLKSIGFSIRHHGANHWYIYTSKNKFTGYLLYGESDTRIVHTLEDYMVIRSRNINHNQQLASMNPFKLLKRIFTPCPCECHKAGYNGCSYCRPHTI